MITIHLVAPLGPGFFKLRKADQNWASGIAVTHQKCSAAVLEDYDGGCDTPQTRGLPTKSNHTLTDQGTWVAR